MREGCHATNFFARRQEIESAGATKKGTCLFCHKDKIRIRKMTIWPFFIALESKLTTTIILHQRASLNSKIGSKGNNNKVARCGNQRALYALARRTMFIIISPVFRNYTQEEVLNMSKLELFLVFFPFGYLNTILIPKTNKILNDPLDLGEFMRCVDCWFYMTCWVRTPYRRDW